MCKNQLSSLRNPKAKEKKKKDKSNKKCLSSLLQNVNVKNIRFYVTGFINPLKQEISSFHQAIIQMLPCSLPHLYLPKKKKNQAANEENIPTAVPRATTMQWQNKSSADLSVFYRLFQKVARKTNLWSTAATKQILQTVWMWMPPY